MPDGQAFACCMAGVGEGGGRAVGRKKKKNVPQGMRDGERMENVVLKLRDALCGAGR